MVAFDQEPLHRGLDATIKVAGLEVNDLLVTLIIAGICSMIFGQTFLALPLGVGLPGIVLCVLSFAKRSKPPRYLRHLAKSLIESNILTAGKKTNIENLRKEPINDFTS